MIARRTFLKLATTMASALPAWLASPLIAHAQVPIRRYDANSQTPAAQAALRLFRDGVSRLKARKPHDPTGWIWQANMHGWPGQFGANPSGEFARVFPTQMAGIPIVERQRLLDLARLTWGKCPHGPPQFLPWHRVYVYCFERILQTAVNDQSAGIPYWNWTRDRTLPVAFREPVAGDQARNALYFSPRNPGVSGNAKGEMPASIFSAEVDVANMLSNPALDVRIKAESGALRGFGQMLEGGPHGNVHVFVGDDRGMGFFESAARDPVFWAHHANIDRLWESWSRVPGHAMPAEAAGWLADKHTFIAPDGQAQTLTTGQVLIASTILGGGYEYEELEPSLALVAMPAASIGPASAAAPASGRVAATAGKVTLSNAPTAVTLVGSVPSVGVGAASAGTARYQLVLNDLSTRKSPRDNFGVYLNAPQGATLTQDSPHFVGTFNFFTASRPAAPGVSGAQHSQHEPTPLDATETVRRLQQAGLWTGGEVSVTIAPIRGNVDPAARPTVGSIELIRN